MVLWVLDKFVHPDHAALVFGSFYGLPGLGSTVFYGVGVVQGLLVLAFMLGVAKRWSTLAVLVMHAVSTLAPMGRYLDPWADSNRLFFAAWPMLAALVALYLLRDYDTLGQWNKAA